MRSLCPCPMQWAAPGRMVTQVLGIGWPDGSSSRSGNLDPQTGERLEDVILIWVSGPDEKRALVEDQDSPFFTTDHFAGHSSVLVRARDLPLIDVLELRELIQEAWLTRAPARARRAWLDSNGDLANGV